MYARVARFEGANLDTIDDQVAEMQRQSDEAKSKGIPEDAPPEMHVLAETVSRFVWLVDRKSGASLGISFFESEDDMRRGDEAMNSMSPGDEGGRRTGVEMYEVVLDDTWK